MNTLVLKKSVLLAFLAAGVLTGCAGTQTVEGEYNPDPYEDTNRAFYRFNDALDRHVMRPVAETYADVTPKPVRSGVTNFFGNLEYLNVILHSFLQGKLKQGFSDAARFTVNSTVGIGGLFDVASGMGLREHDEDFGQTLATWGFYQGPFLNLPFFGPNTARNTPDFASSYLANPLTYLSSIFLFPVTALNFVNTRANLLEASEFVEEAAIDPYSFIREAYLQQRKYLIHDGNPPAEGYDDIFDTGLEDDSMLIIE